MKTTTHQGSRDCGSVQFEADLDLAPAKQNGNLSLMRMAATMVGGLILAMASLASPVSAFEEDPLTWSHINPSTGKPDWLYRAPSILSFSGDYASAIRHTVGGKTQTWYYSNERVQDYGAPYVCPGTTCPGLVLYKGSWSGVGTPTVVALNSIINDVLDPVTGLPAENRFFTRPTVRKVGTNEWWAMAYVSDGYPPRDGNVVPALLRSSDGVRWTYKGRIKSGEVGTYLSTHRSWGSSMAFEAKPGTVPLNHAVPKNNKFVAVVDAMGPRLALIYSANGSEWYFAKNSEGTTTREVLPSELVALNKGTIFGSMRYVPATRGYLMATTDGWNGALNPPYRNHFMMYSCDLLNWRLLGDPAKTGKSYAPGKNFSLTHVASSTVFGLAGYDAALWPESPKVLVKVTLPATLMCP